MAVAAGRAWTSCSETPTSSEVGRFRLSASRELWSSAEPVFSVPSFGQPELDRLPGRPKGDRGDLRHHPLRP